MKLDRLRLGLPALTQLIVALDYNIVYVALPGIGHALGFSPPSVQWVVSAHAVGPYQRMPSRDQAWSTFTERA
jgi:hypothetical protein